MGRCRGNDRSSAAKVSHHHLFRESQRGRNTSLFLNLSLHVFDRFGQSEKLIRRQHHHHVSAHDVNRSPAAAKTVIPRLRVVVLFVHLHLLSPAQLNLIPARKVLPTSGLKIGAGLPVGSSIPVFGSLLLVRLSIAPNASSPL